MKAKEQFRIINDPKSPEHTQVPVMPLLVVFENEMVGEARTIRGAVALVVGNKYFDAEDAIDEWHERVEASRKEAMKAVAWDRYAVTYDKRKGVIDYNFAASPEDPDYEIETAAEPIKIRVDNERMFLLSLMQLGTITILEREDSYLLRHHDKWVSEGPQQRCGSCRYQTIEMKGEFICPVYNEYKSLEDGKDCSSFGIRVDGSAAADDYKGGTYINLAEEYDLNELVNVVGQEWIVGDQPIN